MHYLMAQEAVVACAGRTVVEENQVFVAGFGVASFYFGHIELFVE